MLTVKEAAKALGIDTGSSIGDLGQASAVLKFFGIVPTMNGTVKTYAEADVAKVKALKDGF